MKRRDFLKMAGAGIILLSTLYVGKVFAASHTSQKPNILWLVAEDLCPDLGCYGNDIVYTPNIDKLASEGMKFSNAFTTGAVCTPSRSAFVTGMYQTSIDSHQHTNHKRKRLRSDVKLITEYFREQGYFVFNGDSKDLNKPGKEHFNFLLDEKPFDGTDWRQRKEGQPFFGMIQFFETHRDFKRDPSRPIDPKKVTLPPYYPDHPLARRDWADYLEDAQILDKKVGQMLERLDKDGLTDNTIIFFFGDHGRPHIRGKQFLYDGGIHIPLIIKWKGHIEPKSTSDDLVSAIDFGPTCMALADVKGPKNIHGQPFLGPNAKKRDFIVAARDRCGEATDRIRCVRTKHYKYIRNFYPQLPYTQFSAYKEIQYPMLWLMRYLDCQEKLTPAQKHFMAATRPYEELYDIQKDPHEINNLAENPEYESALVELRTTLDTWVKEMKDPAETPESWEDQVWWYQKNQKWYKREMEARGLTTTSTPREHVEYWTKRLLQ